eukprot:TRINITY_DN62455_c0_g1_i1.p1 TRINITY_DN62455_c0_g1~~TRINITY_DN62455_c0_g1_i1.p1  ORF type:complete len:1846 (+),score=263.86 TRINITY_DN62455_c0_g1_i1:279-5540(+)
MPGGLSGSCELQLDDCSELEDDIYTLYRMEDPARFLVPSHRGEAVRAIEFIPDALYAASGGDDGFVRLWNPLQGTEVRTLANFTLDNDAGLRPEPVLALLYLSILPALVIGTSDRIVYVDVATGTRLQVILRSSAATSIAHLAPHGFLAVTRVNAVEIFKLVEPCADGRRPVSEAECEPCPQNLAGSGGLCQIACRSGNSSSSNRTSCEPCSPGTGGTNGFCERCQPGEFQDDYGQVSCKRCRKGAAQPNYGRMSCVPCFDNTAARFDGQRLCEECPDGTEPSLDHTRCVQCSEGFAGERGVCFRCSDGQQPSADFSKCISCPAGTAGDRGICILCKDGTQPSAGLTACTPCPDSKAGTKGFCTRCQPGQMPSEDSSFCMSCPPGDAGTNGTCAPCKPGFIPNADRVTCEECPRGQPSRRGVCMICGDGLFPKPDRTNCLPCPRGNAGRDGECELCPVGTRSDEAKVNCVPCLVNEASSVGVCEICPDGTHPNDDQSTCVDCEPGRAGVEGICEACADGQRQTVNRSGCEVCPIGRAGFNGICNSCSHPLMQNAEKTECTLQTVKPMYMFTKPQCGQHPVCLEHFAREMKPSLFCCPDPDGNLLSCCQFESPEEKEAWGSFTRILDAVLLVFIGSFWYPPLGSLIGIAVAVRLTYQMAFSEDWEEWREDIVISRWIAIMIPPLLIILVLIFPWLLLGAIITFWIPLLCLLIFGSMHKLIVKIQGQVNDFESRPKAVRSLRLCYFFFFVTEAAVSALHFAQHVFIIRVEIADLCSSTGSNLIRHLAFEKISYDIVGPEIFKELLRATMAFVRAPGIIMANFLVHISIHSECAGVTLLLAGAVPLAITFATYVVLVCNAYGRIAAAKQGVTLAKKPLRWRLWCLFILGLMDVTMHLSLHILSVFPARMAALVVQLLNVQTSPIVQGPIAPYVTLSLLLYLVSVQVLILLLWSGVANGSHVDNPPSILATMIQRYTGLPSDVMRREAFLVRSVLRILKLSESDSDEPQSPRSGSSSPRGSPRRTTSTAAPLSPSSSGRTRAKTKNFGSVAALARMEAASPRNSPKGGSSSQRSSSSRAGRAKNCFVRMPDGRQLNLNEGSGSPRARRFNKSKSKESGRSGLTRVSRMSRSASSFGGFASDASDGSRRTSMFQSIMSRTSFSSNVELFVPDVAAPCFSRRESRAVMALTTWEFLGEQDEFVGSSKLKDTLEQLPVAPQQLYNRVPRPDIIVSWRGAVKGMFDTLRITAITAVGHWKESWNVETHKVRLRTRNLTKEVGRKHFDKHDYQVTEMATAHTIANTSLILPGGCLVHSMIYFCNRPVLRHCDNSLDIMRHKIEEYVERGTPYKQAEIALKNSVISSNEHRRMDYWYHKVHHMQKVLSMVTLMCQLATSLVINGRNGRALASPIVYCSLLTLVVHAFVEKMILPLLMLPTIPIQISVRRKSDEENAITERLVSAIGDSESSDTADDSSDYSSANDSFLDEDPKSTHLPSALGAKRAKVIVRPKVVRLDLRFTLLRAKPAVGEFCRMWRRQAMEKYGRILRDPTSSLGPWRRRSKSFSFSPTLGSDWQGKVKEHKLIRSASMATCTAEEQVEKRSAAERWAGFADIFEEGTRSGFPELPKSAKTVPKRGIVDLLEAQHAFKKPEKEVTNKQLFFMNAFTDTAVAERIRTALGRNQPRPWEEDFDETLALKDSKALPQEGSDIVQQSADDEVGESKSSGAEPVSLSSEGPSDKNADSADEETSSHEDAASSTSEG